MFSPFDMRRMTGVNELKWENVTGILSNRAEIT